MNGQVLEVAHLSKHFPIRAGLMEQLLRRGEGPAVRAVDDVSFTLKQGEVLGIVGESGCGKSTTGLTVLKLHEPTRGVISFMGENVAPYRGRALLRFRRQAQMIFQDPYQSLNPRFTIAEVVAEPLAIHGIARGAAAEEIVAAVLDDVGLRPPAAFLDRYPHELSGGQRQRVAIARAMVLAPKLLVADEPVSMLDVSVRAGILKLLHRFSREAGLSTLYISHDISTVRFLCDRTAVMYMGRIVEIGPTAEVLSNPKHPYTRALIAAVPRVRNARKRARVRLPGDVSSTASRPSGCVFHPRCPRVFDPCAGVVPELMPPSGGQHAVACHLYDERFVGENAIVAAPHAPAPISSIPTVERHQ
jgi:peptide/nickel transport system ATP-binding protein